MKIRGTDCVIYQVSNLTHAAAFYRDVLGLAQEIRSAAWQWVGFNCGNVTLALGRQIKLPEVFPGGLSALTVDDVPAPARTHAERCSCRGGGSEFFVLLSHGNPRPGWQLCDPSQTVDDTFGNTTVRTNG